MTKVNFAAAKEKAAAEGLLGSKPWKPKEGDNRIRLVSECLPHPGNYNGKATFKWLCQILDKASGLVLPYFMPSSVYDQIEALQTNPEYAFEEVPMPYEVTLNAKGAGSKDVVYTVTPARTNTPLTEAEKAAVADAGSIRDYQKSVYESQGVEQTIQVEKSAA